MKIPFTLDAWLKDKSQRVETRDGRIVHNIWRVKEPIIANGKRAEVCALIDGEEDALVFFEGGRYLPTTKDTDNPFDLFIITPEPELTAFEKKVYAYCDGKTVGEELIKRIAKQLLDLARKELVEEQYTSDPRKTDLYKLGKVEALKDLPRWKKYSKGTEIDPLAVVRFSDGYIGRSKYASEDCYVLEVKDMLKLPGFKED